MSFRPYSEQNRLGFAKVPLAVESGRFSREEDALQEALSLWENRERRRAEILAAVDQAEASLARGEGRIITTKAEAMQLADEIKLRGVSRLSAEMNRRWGFASYQPPYRDHYAATLN